MMIPYLLLQPLTDLQKVHKNLLLCSLHHRSPATSLTSIDIDYRATNFKKVESLYWNITINTGRSTSLTNIDIKHTL